MTLSIVGIQAAQKQQRVTTINNDMNQLKLALVSYYNDYRMYPSTIDTMGFDTSTESLCFYEPTTSPIAHYDCSDSSGKTYTIKFSQPGINMHRGEIGSPNTACSDAEHAQTQGNTNYDNLIIPTSEKWVLDYLYQAGSRPQSYKLKFCDESGITEFLSQ